MTPPDVNSAEAAPRLGLLTGLFANVAALRARADAAPAMVKSAGWSMGSYAVGAAASFAAQVILARALDATRYGVYSYLLAWVNVAALLGKLEFDTAAIRFVAAYDGRRQDGLLRGFLQYGWRVVSRTATSVALVAGMFAWLLRHYLSPGIEGGIFAACLLVPLTALLAFSSCALQGFRKVPQAQVPQALLRPVLFGAAIMFVGSGLQVPLSGGAAIAINAAATAVALGVSVFLLDRTVPAGAKAAAPAFEPAQWLRAVRSFLLISAAQLVLSQQADILVVGTVLSHRDAGLYSVASQLSGLAMLGAQAVIFVVLPVISDLYSRGRRAELQRLVVRTVQGCAALSIPVIVLLLAGGRVVLRAYGVVLGTGTLVGATMGIISGFLLTMTGHERAASRMVVGTALLNLVLTVLLTPAFGALGTAMATVVAGFTRVGLLAWYARRHLGVAILPYFPAERSAAARP